MNLPNNIPSNFLTRSVWNDGVSDSDAIFQYMFELLNIIIYG